MIEKSLKKLGYTPNQIKVYLALFKLGKVRAGQIIAETGMYRNLVYAALEDLVKKTLVTKTTQNGVAVFHANAPENMFTDLDEKRRIAEDVVDQLKKKQVETPREVSVHEGFDGFKRVREKSLLLPKGETVYVVGGSRKTTTPEFETFWANYSKKRVAKQIKLKLLFDHTTDPEFLANRNSLKYSEARYLPESVESPIWFEVHGDQVGIGIPDDEALIFSIKSKKVASGFRKYFEYLWKNSEKFQQ